MRGLVNIAMGLLLVGSGCATLAGAATGDRDLPNAEAGPFRELKKGELGLSLVTPNAADDTKTLSRDVSVIDLDGDPATFAIAGYFAASANGAEVDEPTIEIRRTVAEDARSFDRQREVVLQVSEAWEEGTIGGRARSRDGEVWLFYAGGQGIGLATSGDGVAFSKHAGGPVLGVASEGWDAGAVPKSPSVVELPGGELAMFYEVTLGDGKSAIGEARSGDGVSWERVGEGPRITPGPAGEEAYDDARVGGPCAVAAVTELGRDVLRLYYSAESSAGKRTIGLAARFEDEAFERAASPVFGAGSSRGPSEPSVIAFDGFTMIFATQSRSNTDESPAVAGGVAPAQAVLPPPAEMDP
ncbi:MAG: hypothetical protein R3B70_01925 [Polyangiaceae bacterium]